MKVKHEGVTDLVLLIQRKVNDYNDHKSALAEKLEQIEELVDQLEPRVPWLPAFFDLKRSIKDDGNTLQKLYPESMFEYLEQIYRAIDGSSRRSGFDG